MIVRFYIILFAFCWFITENIYCQSSVLLLQNPSFEDTPGFSRTPRGWFYCGEIGESPPDVHPYDAMYGVVHEARDGYTYIGMVVRDNNTWEGLSQWLTQPLQAGKCYEFSLYAARSPYYQSISRTTWRVENFDRPVVLRLWGGNLNCDKTELLAVSAPVTSTDWQRQTFQFQPKVAYNRMVIEAYYTADTPYCGNVLIDAASPIIPVDCQSGAPAVSLETLALDMQMTSAEMEHLARQISFSEVDQQLLQHAFLLPSGELHQANKPLFLLAKVFVDTPDRKLIFHLNEHNKRFYKIKSESLERELLLYGLHPKQFRIQKYRPSKDENALKLEVLVEVQ